MATPVETIHSASMIFTRYHTDRPSRASYVIGDTTTGQAVVVDPRRDVAVRLANAQRAGLRILARVNTHSHADCSSGHLEPTEADLFIADVGRPDLLTWVGGTADELGAQPFDTIQRKLTSPPRPVGVLPGHDPNSTCEKHLATERQSTIGEQRASATPAAAGDPAWPPACCAKRAGKSYRT